MLLYVKEDNKIYAWNTLLSFNEAQEHIGKNGCIWYDGTLPKTEVKEGYTLVYFYENGEITVKYVEIEPVNPEPSQLDRIEAAVTASNEQIAQEARDAYTLELINSGII